MHWAIRTASLFFGAVLGECFVLWWASTIGRFDFAFWEGAKLAPIFSLAMLYTVYSLMLPPTNWAINGCKWGDNAVLEIFLLTSLFLAPLLLAFPPPERELQAIFMSNTEYLSLFFAAWVVQGAVNAVHVHLVMRQIDA